MDTRVSDRDLELLSQWVDGELNEVDGRRLRQRITSDSDLRAAFEAMTELNASLRQAMGERTTIPAAISSQLTDPSDDLPGRGAAQPGDNVVRFPGASAAERQARRWPLAAAASVAAVLGVTLLAGQGGQQPAGLPGNDALVSAALDRVASGSGWAQLTDGRELQPVLSFAHRDGNWCREFLLRTQQSDWRAVACRQDGSWTTQAAGLESYLDSASAYRPAGASEAASVSVFINEYAADIALGRDEEQAVISDGWQ